MSEFIARRKKHYNGIITNTSSEPKRAIQLAAAEQTNAVLSALGCSTIVAWRKCYLYPRCAWYIPYGCYRVYIVGYGVDIFSSLERNTDNQSLYAPIPVQ